MNVRKTFLQIFFINISWWSWEEKVILDGPEKVHLSIQTVLNGERDREREGGIPPFI
jgi:hypothetical protein